MRKMLQNTFGGLVHQDSLGKLKRSPKTRSSNKSSTSKAESIKGGSGRRKEGWRGGKGEGEKEKRGNTSCISHYFRPCLCVKMRLRRTF